MMQCMTWYLLDTLIRSNGGPIPSGERERLKELWTAMKKKGVDTGKMADEWDADEVAEALNVTVHEEYRALLQEV